jgi:hypothetical protein
MPELVRRELPAIHAVLARQRIGEILDPALDPGLALGLRQRVELPVGDDLGRHRRMERRLLGRLGPYQLGIAQQDTHQLPPLRWPVPGPRAIKGRISGAHTA